MSLVIFYFLFFFAYWYAFYASRLLTSNFCQLAFVFEIFLNLTEISGLKCFVHETSNTGAKLLLKLTHILESVT